MVNEPVGVHGFVHLHGHGHLQVHVKVLVDLGRHANQRLGPSPGCLCVPLLVSVAVSLAVNAHGLVHDQV